MNKKSFLLAVSLSTCLLVVGTVMAASITDNFNFSVVHGDDNPYVLNLNRSVTSGEITAGETTFNTTSGNPIVFKFDSSKASVDSGLISLSTGGNFYNETKITGITKIEGTITGGSATLSFGNDIDCLNVGSQSLDTSGEAFTINLAYPSDYFKISDITGPLAINNLKFTYSCSNDYAYASAREAANGDLLFRSSDAWRGGWNEHNHYDMRSFNTINSTSGYSYHFYCDESGNDWPYLRIELPHSFDLTHSHVEVSAKFVTTKGWVGFKFYDSSLGLVSYSWRTNLDFGSDYEEYLDWSTKSISNAFLSNADTLQAGKDLTDIKYIDISVNFNNNKGRTQDIFVDELRFVDEATKGMASAYNVENAKFDSTQWRANGGTAETIYNETKQSGSATKVTFQDYKGSLPGRTYASFNLAETAAIGTGNGISPVNSTISFDIKLSEEFFTSGHGSRHQFTLKLEDNTWANQEKYYDYSPSGQSGFDGNTSRDWFHVSYNLSAKYTLAGSDIYVVTIGFFGLNATTSQSAWVIIDNLSIVPNA